MISAELASCILFAVSYWIRFSSALAPTHKKNNCDSFQFTVWGNAQLPCGALMFIAVFEFLAQGSSPVSSLVTLPHSQWLGQMRFPGHKTNPKAWSSGKNNEAYGYCLFHNVKVTYSSLVSTITSSTQISDSLDTLLLYYLILHLKSW